HAHRAIAAGAANDRLDAWIEPHAHEILGAAFVLGALEAAAEPDYGVEDDREADVFECFHAAHEPARSGSIRRRDHADRVSLRDGSRAQQRWRCLARLVDHAFDGNGAGL